MEHQRPISLRRPSAAAVDDSGEVLASFLASGVYGLLESDGDQSPGVFLDPVRILNHRSSNSRFRLLASSYYSRSFLPRSSTSLKRKRSKPPSRELNDRERDAERRHQEVRPFLLRAHRALLNDRSVLTMLSDLVNEGELGCGARCTGENDFVALGRLWQAPMYEMEAFPGLESRLTREKGGSSGILLCITQTKQFSHDITQIHNLIPGDSECGYNLIVVDPPWENRSADQKALYPILPNRNFLHLPIKQLAHVKGALLLLWVTNREKLRLFVENELLTAWGVSDVVKCHWLKVKMDGSLINELDLFHHRPYESFLLGYINCKDDLKLEGTLRYPQNNQVFISIPGAYSRKPPIGLLLDDYVPGPKPLKCIELFARELHAGWTSWGNEPLHFQDLRYFIDKSSESAVV